MYKSKNSNSYQQSLFSCCQMAEQVLSQELLWSDGGRSISYLFYLAQLQLLRADYCSAAASLKEALSHSNQVFTLSTGCRENVISSMPQYCSVSSQTVIFHMFKLQQKFTFNFRFLNFFHIIVV